MDNDTLINKHLEGTLAPSEENYFKSALTADPDLELKYRLARELQIKFGNIPQVDFAPGFAARVMHNIISAESPGFEFPNLTQALWNAFRPLALVSLFIVAVLSFSTFINLNSVPDNSAGSTIMNQDDVLFEEWWSGMSDQITGGLL